MTRQELLSLDGTGFEGREDEFYSLWILATAVYGVGDVVTTIALLDFSPTVDEANVLLRAAVETFGHAGLVGLKLAVFFACLGIHVYGIRDSEDWVVLYAPPVVLAIMGAFFTSYNMRLLLG
ncbi:hypothetical protein [Haladaptatus sp. NG-WS-4]